MYEKIFTWIGIIAICLLCIILLIAAINDFIVDKVKLWIRDLQINRYKAGSLLIGVKIPTSDKKIYTPIAYLYSRRNRWMSKPTPPVVTIIGQNFFKKLPDDTNVFIISKESKIDINVNSVGQLKQLLRNYHQSISSEGWE